VYVDKYRDAIFAVPAYKPVANKPTTYDADGSVLRGMGPAIMRYWQHCYGADGCGGAAAALTAAAREALYQLACVPLVLAPAGEAGEAGEGMGEGSPEGATVPLAGCEGLNKLLREQEALSTAFSVHTFLEQEVRGVSECVPVWQAADDRTRLPVKAASFSRLLLSLPLTCTMQHAEPPDLPLRLPYPPAAAARPAACLCG
jgi:hypothetical protein